MKSKVIAATWDADQTLHVLLASGSTRKTAAVRGGRAVDVRAAVPKASRLAVLPDGSVLTTNTDGKARLVSPDGTVAHDDMEWYLSDLVVSHGVAYAMGTHRVLVKWDLAKRAWAGSGLRDALDVLLAKHDEAVGTVHAVVAGPRGPIAAVQLDTPRENILMEHDGKRWRRRAALPHRVNAIAWAPRTNTVYTVGDDIYAVGAKGRVTPVPNPGDDERDYWSAAWAGDRLLVGTLDSVESIDVRTGRSKNLLAPTKGEVPHNHSLSFEGRSVAFVRDGAVFTLQGPRMARVRLSLYESGRARARST